MLMQQQESAAWKVHNPFALRVGQVFTGFGVGCGIGVGVGQPINLRALPVIGSVAGEAIGSFNSLRPHVASLGKKLGIKNIQAGVGCGVGIGHGFGIGVTLKPGTVQQLKQLMEQAYSAINERVRSSMGSTRSEESSGNEENTTPAVNERKLLPDIIPTNSITTTIQSLGNSMQSTSMAATKLQSAQEPTHGEVNRLQTENRILLTLLTHQEQIELLRKENAALKQALAEVEDATSKPKASSDDHGKEEPHKSTAKCFECRRKVWQRR